MTKGRRSFLIFLSWLSLIFSILIFGLFLLIAIASFRIEATKESKAVAWLILSVATLLPSTLLFVCSIFLKKTVKEEGLLGNNHEFN